MGWYLRKMRQSVIGNAALYIYIASLLFNNAVMYIYNVTKDVSFEAMYLNNEVIYSNNGPLVCIQRVIVFMQRCKRYILYNVVYI